MRTPLARTRALVGGLIGLMLVGIAVPAAAADEPVTFADVPETHTFATEIGWMAEAGISRGWETAAGTVYRPLGNVTREQMAAFLYRYAGSPEFADPARPTFTDVPRTSTFYTEIEWLADQEITQGWSDGTFRPRASITREQMAAFLYRLAEASPVSSTPAFADSSTSPFEDEIEWLATRGVSQGWLNWRGRVYRPTASVTREAMAAFLYRLEHGAEPVTAHDPVFEPTSTVWVTAATLNLRAEATWASDIVFTAKKNASATFDGAREYGWQRVTVGGLTGWAPTEYLRTTKPSFTATRVGMKVSELWFRDGPTNENAVLTKVAQGTRGTFLGVIHGSWWLVSVNGVTGWAPAQHMNTVTPFNPSAVLAKAYSEVGYRSPNWNYNKFNEWAGGTNPWCMVYVMWVFDQVGMPQGVPFKLLYADWARDALASGVVDTDVTASDLKRGYVVLVDWPPYNGPTHTGIVDYVDGDMVRLVEGNTVDGSGDKTRGVFAPLRRIVDMYGVFNPDEYARVHGY